MKVSDLLSRAVPKPVPKGRNLDQIGWVDGYLLVRFRGRGDLYVFGPSIPEAEMDKLLRVPYPDKLFTQNIKGKYQSFKVSRAA